MEDFLRATQAAVLDNEAKVLATKMGLPHVSLLQRANPDNDSHNLTIQHLFGILLHSGDMRPLRALADAFGFDLVSREAVTAKDLSGDRKSTRLNSSHVRISYAVFCLKKKTKDRRRTGS